MTHICVGKLTILGSDNGLSPGRRQAIIWTNALISLIGPFGTNFSEILIGIHTFSFKEMQMKMASAKWRPFCLGLSELIPWLHHHNIIGPRTDIFAWNTLAIVCLPEIFRPWYKLPGIFHGVLFLIQAWVLLLLLKWKSTQLNNYIMWQFYLG